MKNKLLCMLLAALMLVSLFAACADKGEGEQSTTSAETEEGNVYDQALSQISADWGEEDFCVLGRNDAANSVTEIHREETSTDPLEDAVYRRNMALSEMCNLNYLTSLVGTEEVTNKISNDIRSGSNEYAIAMPNMMHAGNMATQNMLMDFNDMAHIDLDADWWDQGTAAMNVAGKNFWMNSDINFLAHDVTFLTLFSKVMAEKQGIESLYETVENHEWTLDVFAAYIKKVSADLDGNGKYDEADSYGLIGTSTMGYNMFYASNLKFVGCDAEGEPYLAMTDSDLLKATDLLEKLLDMLYTGNSTYIVAAGKENNAMNMFSNNQGLFYVECASYIVNLRNMSDDFGVLPLPKYNEAQENYSTYVHSISTTMVIPQGNKNFEEMSKVIETMAILSGKMVKPTYYDLVLKRKTVRDEDSAGMLDIIFSNRTYDLAFYYDKLGLMHVFQNAVDSKNASFSSNYTRAASKAERELRKIVGKLEDTN